ncbi:MAG: hypothetical protein AAGI53_10225 [Planctomycetota bacterium]
MHPSGQHTTRRIAAAAWAASCVVGAATVTLAVAEAEPRAKSIRLPENPQELGDPDEGYRYLLHGDYIGSGIPLRLYASLSRGEPEPEHRLERLGSGADLPHLLNAFTMPSGAEVVAGMNCLGCHAQVLGDELVIGLGNSLSDWTDSTGLGPVQGMVRLMYPPEHPERVAAEQFLRGVNALQGKTAAPFRGVNPAFRLEEVAAAYRDPEDLSWTEQRGYDYGEIFIASDVPPWWNVKKKNALYYTGLGRGDFAKLIQQINVVGIGDKTDAARINESMHDLLAYIMTVEAPLYPGEIDQAMAVRGATVFEMNCAKCHGTYDTTGGDDWTYPNKLIPLEKIGTDPEYALDLKSSGLHEWFTESWYAKTEPKAWAEPGLGYVAPPLDGVWATAPYFHNASVPTLEGVLDSEARPTYWRRSFSPADYDLAAPGWAHTVETGPIDAQTYDTTLPGYGNQGHTYGDDLTDDERRAVIEYLKTL